LGPRPPRPSAYRPAKPKSDEPVYVRFACFQTIEGERTRIGLFQAIKVARASDLAVGWALEDLNDVSSWFDDNLDVPGRFYRGAPGRDYHSQSGLSWFKPAAEEHIRQMHRARTAMEECGVHVEVLTTRDPGTIIWEDENQIVAEPGNRRFRS